MGNTNKEIERIKNVYNKRTAEIPAEFYSCFRPVNLYYVQTRESLLLKLLREYGIFSLGAKRILDIGCGSGHELRRYLQYGAIPDNLSGIDVLPERIALGKKTSPNIDMRCGDASNLPYENDSFDIVSQYTVFTSILDDQMKQRIAGEMLRVLKPDGIIIWYDYHMDNPRNPDVKGVKKREINQLFRECYIDLRRITLAPPLARAVAPYSVGLCKLLEMVPLLRTHYLGIIRRA